MPPHCCMFWMCSSLWTSCFKVLLNEYFQSICFPPLLVQKALSKQLDSWLYLQRASQTSTHYQIKPKSLRAENKSEGECLTSYISRVIEALRLQKTTKIPSPTINPPSPLDWEHWRAPHSQPKQKGATLVTAWLWHTWKYRIKVLKDIRSSPTNHNSP